MPYQSLRLLANKSPANPVPGWTAIRATRTGRIHAGFDTEKHSRLEKIQTGIAICRHYAGVRPLYKLKVNIIP